MLGQKSHPEKEQLTAFALGQVEPAVIEEVGKHLADCPECRAVVRDTPEDTFVSLVRDSETVRTASPRPDSLPHEQTTDLASGALGKPGSGEAWVQAKLPPTVASAAISGPNHDIHSALKEYHRYRIVDVLGTGGMGAVYLAEHRMMQRQVALKVISPRFVADRAAVDRFHREVRAAARLHHPNIVTAYDAEQVGDTHLLVMEYVPGKDLSQVLEERHSLSVEEACEYARQAALGLQHAHEQGMVHRDIKPHNLMLTPEGQVKILDFGLASLHTEPVRLDEPQPKPQTVARNPQLLTQKGTIMGTPDYMAPEQARDAHSADIRADIYSLGCTAYTLLTGKVPFPGGSSTDKILAHHEKEPVPVTEFRDDIPIGLEKVLNRMVAKNPHDRYQTPREVADALSPFANRVGPASSVEEADIEVVVPRRPRRSRRTLILTLVAAAAVALLAGVIYFATDRGELVIENKADDVKVVVSKDGKEYMIIDAVTSSTVTRLPSGKYEIVLKGDRNKVELDRKSFTMTRGGKIVVTVRPRNVFPTFDEEFKLMIKIARDQLTPEEKKQLAGENHPYRFQMMDPPTRKTIELFGQLKDSAHKDLIEKGYLKWKFSDLSKKRQEGFRDWIGRSVELIKQQGRTPPENYTLESLEKADVGFAVVDIPDLETRVVSAYIFMPMTTIPEWVTIVGTQAAGKEAYFGAHRAELPELAEKGYSDIKEAFPE